MILKAKELQQMPEFATLSKKEIRHKLTAVEKLIRAHTNNNFQNRKLRYYGDSSESLLYGVFPFLQKGDTVQISRSINDGLYVVKKVCKGYILLDKPLKDAGKNMITKVEYPEDVVQGVINLMKWEQENRHKVGIKSETLSRHSVTYYDQDASNTTMGYPVSLLAFLKPYMRARC